MSQPAVQNSYYTPEEYLSYEDDAEYKSEYFNGEIIAMAGGSAEHSIICVNMMRRLSEKLDNRECFVFDSNMKLDIQTYNHFVYPDVMVVCGEIEFSRNRTDIIQNPVLVIEVLSPATRHFDRGDKFTFYRSIPSMKEYAMISQDEPMIEVYYKQNHKTWIYTIAKGLDDSVQFRTLDIELPLKHIYHKIVRNSQRPS